MLAAGLLYACSANPPAGGTDSLDGTTAAATEPAETPTSFAPPDTATSEPPTPTPIPLALAVNAVEVSLDDFNAALQRFHAGIPEAPTEEAVERVRQDFIDQILLAQAAADQGFNPDDALVGARLEALLAEIGGEGAFSTWLEANFYTPERFDREFRRAIAAAWMRDRIVSAVEPNALQVRARHIRVNSRGEADAVLAELNAGTSFDIMVQIYDPVGLGDLGWFPQGYLLEPAIEVRAFEMEVGEISEVIESGVGFHLLQVTDRQEDRPLEPDAYWTLQQRALAGWLSAQEAAADIQIYEP